MGKFKYLLILPVLFFVFQNCGDIRLNKINDAPSAKAEVAIDTTPDAFGFIPQTDVELNTLTTSNTITVSGLNAATPISIIDGEYSVNGEAYTSEAGTVITGDTVTVRLISSSSNATLTTATLIIGEGAGKVSAPFNVTTFVRSLCGTNANSLAYSTKVETLTNHILVNTNFVQDLSKTGQNNNWKMNKGESRSVEFTTGAVGTQAGFMFDMDSSGNSGVFVPIFRNISRTQCDFSYSQVDSGRVDGFNSSACSGAGYFLVQNPGDTPVPGRCSLLPHTTYYLNIRNESVLPKPYKKNPDQRGIDSCETFNTCGFLFTTY